MELKAGYRQKRCTELWIKNTAAFCKIHTILELFQLVTSKKTENNKCSLFQVDRCLEFRLIVVWTVAWQKLKQLIDEVLALKTHSELEKTDVLPLAYAKRIRLKVTGSRKHVESS